MRTPLARILLIVLVAAFTAGATAHAQRAFSVATLAPAGSTWMRVLDSANHELRRRSNNALSLRFYPGGVQGDESEVLRKMRAGRLDGAVITGTGLGQIYRPVLAFSLPGMFPNHDAMERSRAALAPEIEAHFRDQGFVLLSWGEAGSPRMFSRQAVHSPSDLQHVHPWIWRDDPILPALYAEAGAHGVALQLPEVLTALETNRIDTVVAPALAALALQWSTRMSFVSDASPAFGLGGILVNRAAFESLPADQQTMLREIINQYNSLMARNVARDDDLALRSMIDRGMTMVTQTPAERAQWVDLFQRTRARLVGVVADAPFMARVQSGH